MYVNAYKAEAYSYTSLNFKNLEELKLHLKPTEPLIFVKSPICGEYGGQLIAMLRKWKITLENGDMPEKDEGYVDMRYESGAMDYVT